MQLKPVGERFVNIRCKVSNAIYDGESSRFLSVYLIRKAMIVNPVEV